jgi:DNA-directed RNA polymerase subunit RPC12/RpoP
MNMNGDTYYTDIERRIANFDGDTDYTDKVTCPHCGYQYSDSSEMTEGVYECEDCGREFDVWRDVKIRYSTAKRS